MSPFLVALNLLAAAACFVGSIQARTWTRAWLLLDLAVLCLGFALRRLGVS